MAGRDLRDFIDDLEERRELQRIKAEVDWNEELGAITREVSSQYGPALLFENITGHKNSLCRRLFTNGTGSKKRMCWILGVADTTSDAEIVRVFKERFAKPVKPVTVSNGPVKENIVKGDDVDLYQLPVPKWNPLDGGRYIMTSGSVVTRDPDNGTLNVGTYRGMIGTQKYHRRAAGDDSRLGRAFYQAAQPQSAHAGGGGVGLGSVLVHRRIDAGDSSRI